MEITTKQMENAKRKVFLSNYKMGYQIKLYLIEAFGDLNLAWFCERLLNKQPSDCEDIYILTNDEFNKLLKEEVEIALHVQAEIHQCFEHLEFIKQAGGNTGYVINIGKIEEFIISKIG